MYSYTSQLQNQRQGLAQKKQAVGPMLTVRCRCNRHFLQEEIYTCLNCSNYACRYCTVIELHSYFCRNCSDIVSEAECTKLFRCQKCFCCPGCQHVLSIVKDPKARKLIFLCQFCYWNSKEIGVAEEKTEDLLKTMEKISKGIKDSELKAHLNAQRYFKQRHLESQKIKEINKKRSSTASIDLRLLQPSTQVIEEQPLRTTGLDEESVEEDRRDRQLPKGLPLLSRKTRRCTECKKFLTKSFKTFRNEHKVQLSHSEPKVLVCQKNFTPDKVSLKCLQDAVFVSGSESRQYRQGEIIQIPMKNIPCEFQLLVQFAAPNKQKRMIRYNFAVQI